MADPVADPLIELIKQSPALVVALFAGLTTFVSASTAALLAYLTFKKQSRTDEKITKIEEHSNGMLKQLQNKAYDRGVSDKTDGVDLPKSPPP